MINLNTFDVLLLGVLIINFFSFSKIINHEKEIRKLNKIVKHILDNKKTDNIDESK